MVGRPVAVRPLLLLALLCLALPAGATPPPPGAVSALEIIGPAPEGFTLYTISWDMPGTGDLDRRIYVSLDDSMEVDRLSPSSQTGSAERRLLLFCNVTPGVARKVSARAHANAAPSAFHPACWFSHRSVHIPPAQPGRCTVRRAHRSHRHERHSRPRTTAIGSFIVDGNRVAVDAAPRSCSASAIVHRVALRN